MNKNAEDICWHIVSAQQMLVFKEKVNEAEGH